MSLFRDNIEKMKGYVPGEQPQEGDYVKLNTNENPFPPSPKVLAAVKAAAGSSLRLYPDPMATRVREKVAEVLGTRPERVLVGNGSDELLGVIVRAFAGSGEKVVFPYPTYLLYKTLVDVQEAEVVEVDFDEGFSLPEDIIVKGARITFLCNPNSPSGTMVWPDEAARLARQIDGVLAIDEAYVDFADANCLSLVEDNPNVIILRTLSKSYSLAGLRLGFCIAQEGLIEGLIKVKDSYNVDRLSMAAAVAALDDQKHLRENVDRIKGIRGYLSESLREMGFFVYPSQANFVFARCKDAATAGEIYEQLKRQRILVRHINYRGLEDCVRISVGTREEIDTMLGALSEVLCETGKSAGK